MLNIFSAFSEYQLMLSQILSCKWCKGLDNFRQFESSGIFNVGGVYFRMSFKCLMVSIGILLGCLTISWFLSKKKRKKEKTVSWLSMCQMILLDLPKK